MARQAGNHLAWDDLAGLFDRITLQVIFGAGVTDAP